MAKNITQDELNKMASGKVYEFETPTIRRVNYYVNAQNDPKQYVFDNLRSVVEENAALKYTPGLKDLDAFDEVMNNAEVLSVYNKRVNSLVLTPYSVEIDDDSEQAQEAVAKLEEWADLIDYDELNESMMTAVIYGLSVIELAWRRDNKIGLIVPYKWRAVKPSRIVFTDKGEMRIKTKAAPIRGERVRDERRFLVFKYKDEGGRNMYGRGLGNTLLSIVRIIKNAKVSAQSAANRVGFPKLAIKAQGQIDDKQQNEIQEAVEDSNNSGALVLSSNMEAMMLEGTSRGTKDIFEYIIGSSQRLISRVVLGEELTTSTDHTATNAAALTHNKIREEATLRDAKMIEATMRNSLLKWIMDINYPNLPVANIVRNFDTAQKNQLKLSNFETLSRLGYEVENSEHYLEQIVDAPVVKKEVPDNIEPNSTGENTNIVPVPDVIS